VFLSLVEFKEIQNQIQAFGEGLNTTNLLATIILVFLQLHKPLGILMRRFYQFFSIISLKNC